MDTYWELASLYSAAGFLSGATFWYYCGDRVCKIVRRFTHGYPKAG